MIKKLLTGITAFSIAAGCLAITSYATKLGDVNDDNNIDIEDAVAIINQVNGVSRLTDDQEKIADVDINDTVDIEDAVKLINHINGNTPLPDVDVKLEEEIPQMVTITLHETGDSFEIESGSVIPAKYGKGPRYDDLDSYDPASWYLLEFPNKEMMGQEFTQEVDDIVCHMGDEQISIQKLIDNRTPITEDMEFYILFKGHSIKPYGRRTLKVFDDILDNNYKITFKSAEAYGMYMELAIEGEVIQVDEKNSNLKAEITLGSVIKSDIYTIDGTKYYVRDAEKNTYSEEPSGAEAMLDMQHIFSSLATDRENLKFVEETRDEETGDYIETFTTRLDLTDSYGFEHIKFHAYYDKTTKELKRLVVYDEDSYEEDHSFCELYLDTAELKFEPSYEGTIDHPDFSTWTVVKAPIL